MNRRILWVSIFVSSASVAAFAACGEEEASEPPASTTPIIGAFELPISRNNQGSQPSDAVRIELATNEIRVDGRTLLPLAAGRIAESEVTDRVVTKLRERLQSGNARSRAAVWVSANLPYATLADALQTMHAAGVREAHFAVRREGSSPDVGWMRLSQWQVVPEGDTHVRIEGASRPWSEFTEFWREVYTACRAGRYVDCDGRPFNIAQGGELGGELWMRERGMKVTFFQFAMPDAGVPAPQNRGPALIEGVRAPAPVEEEQGPPVAEGSFTFLHQESVEPDSAISEAVRPVCANESCAFTVVADATTPSMRVLSLVGAVYANGFQEPRLAFRQPPR
jgi:hypothetical protein